VTSWGVSSGFYLADAFGVVLEGARERRDLTLEEVALRARLKSTYVERLERGVGEPELSTFIALAAAIRVSPVWLFEETIAGMHRTIRPYKPSGPNRGTFGYRRSGWHWRARYSPALTAS
jgi:transcriptional regulator with XRE-family HTH domain